MQNLRRASGAGWHFPAYKRATAQCAIRRNRVAVHEWVHERVHAAEKTRPVTRSAFAECIFAACYFLFGGKEKKN